MTKLLPLAVSVNCPLPTVADVGLMEIRIGVFGAPIVKATAFETVVPVTTVTLAVPAVAIRVFETDAVNWVLLPKPVTSSLPFHCTFDALVKAEPFTMRMKLPLPGVAEAGDSELMFGPVGAAMVKVNALDVPPFGVVTVTLAVPAPAIRLAVTTPVIWVALTNVVASGLPFH